MRRKVLSILLVIVMVLSLQQGNVYAIGETIGNLSENTITEGSNEENTSIAKSTPEVTSTSEVTPTPEVSPTPEIVSANLATVQAQILSLPDVETWKGMDPESQNAIGEAAVAASEAYDALGLADQEQLAQEYASLMALLQAMYEEVTPYAGDVATVQIKGGAVVTYQNITQAINAFAGGNAEKNGGATLNLLQDVKGDLQIYLVGSAEYTIDLNGHKLDIGNQSVYLASENVKLTIQDSQNSANALLTNDGTAHTVNSAGRVVITGGRVENTGGKNAIYSVYTKPYTTTAGYAVEVVGTATVASNSGTAIQLTNVTVQNSIS